MKPKQIKQLRLLVICLVICAFFIHPITATPLAEIFPTLTDGSRPEKISPELWEQLNEAQAAYGTQAVSGSENTVVAEITFEDMVDYDAVKTEALRRMDNNQRLLVLRALTASSDAELVDIDEEELTTAIESYRASKRTVSKEYHAEQNAEYILANGLDTEDAYVGMYSSFISLPVTRAEAIALAGDNSVICLDVVLEGESAADISIPVTRANIVRDTRGFSGSGIRVGMVEPGVPDTSNAALSGISNRIHIQPNSTSYTEPHATAVACIIVGQATGAYVEGIVPDASLYCASAQIEGGYRAAIEWLIDQGVHVINNSWALRDREEYYNTITEHTTWLDHVAFHDIHMVMATGNDGVAGVSEVAMGYNTISVGNIDDHNTLSLSDDDLWFESSYNSSDEGLMKPDICAPGTYIATAAGTWMGTSFAAPHVTGTVAQLCQQRSTMRIRQDLMKAVLTCTVNQEGPHHYLPDDTGYRQYGAGLMDSDAARWVTHAYRYGYGHLNSTTTSRTYTVTVTSSDEYLRVSLAYLRNVIYGSSANHETDAPEGPVCDLDIEVVSPTNEVVFSSQWSSRSNVEIIQLDPDLCGGPGTYTIEVYVYGAAPTEEVYFGIAWR